MSKTIMIKTVICGEGETAAVGLTIKQLAKLCSFVAKEKDIVIGRYGTNKASLRKLLVEEK